MLFNLNEFLMAVSFTLDFVEMDILGVTSNHGKRTAYLSYKIARELGLNEKELHDIVALAILHDNGVSEKSLHDKFLISENVEVKGIDRIKEHCTIGEDNVKYYPFLTNAKDVIMYHHERYDGTGFFGKKGNEIPIMSQIIFMADVLEVNFDLTNSNHIEQDKIIKFINTNQQIMFSPELVAAYQNAIKDEKLWIAIKDDYIEDELKVSTMEYEIELPIEEVREITGVFSKIIDSKSQYTRKHSSELSLKTEIMANYYKLEHEEKVKLRIAADLHDIGKLAVPNKILDKPDKLSSEEFDTIKKHPYYTRLALQQIKGFEEITEWASNHHEKLNGRGYPFGKSAGDLDFNSRLLACLDIYEAITEERPYRKSLTHKETMDIMYKMTEDGFIDIAITKDIDNVFRHLILD